MFRPFFQLIIILFLSCAHKGPPIRIDRVDPRLKKVTVVNEHLISLDFSEELDSISIRPENFLIYTEQETLKIISANPGNLKDQIALYTQKMAKIEYTLEGKVYDLSKRVGIFKTKFTGSVKPDTIPPVVTLYSKGFRTKNFYLEFSEPVDTGVISYYVFPKRKMSQNWYYRQRLSLIPETDSLNYDTTYYLLLSNIRDLSQNYASPFVTTITPDTIYNPIFIRGRAVINDTSIIRGIGILGLDPIYGVSIIENGEFLFEVRDSLKHFLRVFGENCYGADSISASGTNLIKLAPGVFHLDTIIN